LAVKCTSLAGLTANSGLMIKLDKETDKKA